MFIGIFLEECNGATNCHTKTIEKSNTKQSIKTEVTAI